MLIEYIYGELPADQARSVEAHLAECPDCERYAAELTWTRELAASTPDPEPSRMSVNRILAHAREEAEKPKPLWGLGWAKILAPLCVMFVVGGLVIYQFQAGRLDEKTLSGPVAIKTEPVTTMPEPVAEAPKPAPAEAPARDVAPSPPPSENANESAGEMIEPVLRGGEPKALMPSEAPPGTGVMGKTAAPEIETESAPSAELTPEIAKRAVTRTRKTRDLSFDEEESLRKKPECAPLPKMSKAVPADPDFPKKVAARLMEGRHLLDSGEFEKAGQCFEAVLHELPPGHQDRPKTLLWLARAYEGLGYPVKALETYRILAKESEEYHELAVGKIEELTQKQ
jgi:hypothetical protein